MHSVAEKMEHAIHLLRDKGIRITPQRQEVIRLLIELSHPTPEQLYHEFLKSYPSVSIATIYNNLKALKELGCVQELPFGDHSSRFEWASEPHDHFTCNLCGEISDLFQPQLTQEIKKQTLHHNGYIITSHRLELYGICPKCSVKPIGSNHDT